MSPTSFCISCHGVEDVHSCVLKGQKFWLPSYTQVHKFMSKASLHVKLFVEKVIDLNLAAPVIAPTLTNDNVESRSQRTVGNYTVLMSTSLFTNISRHPQVGLLSHTCVVSYIPTRLGSSSHCSSATLFFANGRQFSDRPCGFLRPIGEMTGAELGISTGG